MCRTTKFQGSKQRLTKDLSNKNRIFIFFYFYYAPHCTVGSHLYLMQPYMKNLHIHLIGGMEMEAVEFKLPFSNPTIYIFSREKSHRQSKSTNAICEVRLSITVWRKGACLPQLWSDSTLGAPLWFIQINQITHLWFSTVLTTLVGMELMCNICIYIFYQMDGQDPLNNTTFPKP